MPTRGSRWAFALTLALVSTTGLLWARDLTFEDRVKAQEAIERVYWSHRIWPKENPGPRPALSSMVSDAVIHAKVADYLRKSNALEQLWHRRITAGQLEAEIARMARETRNPSMLAELFASLNDDPILVAECLARPLLAERLVRNLYVRDEALHRATRLKAEQALSRYSSMKALGEHGGRYSETGFVRLGSPLIRPREDETRVSLDEADWDRLMRDLEPRVGPGMPESQTGLESRGRTDSAGLSKGSCRPGDGSLSQSRPDLGPRRSIDESGGERRPPALLENDESFFVTTVLARDATHIDLATVSWEKPSLVTWWRRVGGEFSTHLDLPPTVPGPLPALAAECADDTWSGMPFGSPDDIGGETAVWTGAEMIVWGGSANFGGGTIRDTGGLYNPATDTWRVTGSSGNLPQARSGHTAVWTGREMLIWGGMGMVNGLSQRLGDGSRYDPLTDAWLPISPGAQAPQARTGHTAVWDGSEMLVWGGNTGGPTNTGGRYDPSIDSWREMDHGTGTPAPRDSHTAIWSGRKMVVWGGLGSTVMISGGAYNPATNAWRPTSTGAGVPAARFRHTAIWTGTEMVVWGGRAIDGGGFQNSGSRYNPSTNTWRATSTGAFTPEPRESHTAVWTGTEMIVWGGRTTSSVFSSGGRYDPAADRWVATATGGNAPTARSGQASIWTGSEMIIWGGGAAPDGARYDPASDSWIPMSTGIPIPSFRSDNALLWTGTEMITWGGSSATGTSNTGARYDPATNAWTATSVGDNVPSPRSGFSAIWSGEEMIVWGGRATRTLATGSRYNPATDSWRPTSVGPGVPEARRSHASVWTGDEMIVWGGDTLFVYLNTGGRYNPHTDTWRPLGLGGNAPTPRSLPSAVWTGTRMVVWGGLNAGGYVSSGNRYDPESDTWATIHGYPDSPAARAGQSVIWTGRVMVLWGGNYGGARTNTGSRYDPFADTWSATSTAGAAPSARSGHGAVWTGSEMVVWGGVLADYVPTSTGARYDPVSNEWRPTSAGNGVPSPRDNVRMVWTGSEAMIWGGDKPDGGRYCAYATCEVRTWYRDADRDGYGRSTDTVAACDQPPSYGALPGDCNDVNTAVHPGAIEACDGNDDNCDGTIDENGAALCDDGDLCTDDLCGGVTGCVHVNNTAPCSDGNACTLGDACSAGICSPGRAVNPKLDCDDHNACTRDYCDEGAGCMNAPIICRDGNPSTLDSCDPRRGCVFTPRHGRQVTAGAHGQVEAEGD